ncbi:MAG: pyrroloquinoline quinone biosynthesis protein PqqE [Chloroflexi bacterium ADurb.Bin360]|nr:MAG: pyrroloquinoline quinone biosynthesis protein PqqE [Chloroflexi bacterium ADurb.Bin360]
MNLPRPHLHSLIFEVTQDCNHACNYCYNVWRGPQTTPYPRGQLDTARTLELLGKALVETRCFHVTLTGGEPLLRPDLLQIIEFLQQRRVQVTLISNGHLLDETMALALVERGVGLFELPLLSHRREVHDALSGVQGAWDAVLAAMANVRLLHGQVIAAFVATRQNIEHIYETVRLAFAFGARGVMFNRFNPGGRGREHLAELLPTVDEVRVALVAAEAAAAEFGIPISCSIPIQPCLIDLDRYPHLSFGFCVVTVPTLPSTPWGTCALAITAILFWVTFSKPPLRNFWLRSAWSISSQLRHLPAQHVHGAWSARVGVKLLRRSAMAS